MHRVNRTVVIAAIIIAGFCAAAYADLAAGAPAGTSGKRILVVYTNASVEFSRLIYQGGCGIKNVLQGFGFTIEEIGVNANFNSGMTYATGASAVDALPGRTLPLTAANYCMVLDLRFINQNVSLGAPTSNYVMGDTITQADVTNYTNYVASGGSLFITGDNYYNPLIPDVEGFTSRMENMYRMINSVASGPVAQTGFRIGAMGPLVASPSGANPYLLETDFNALSNVSGLQYSGYYDTTAGLGSAKVWAVENGLPTHAMGLAWNNTDLKGGYPATSRMVYWGDDSILNNWATCSGSGNMTSFMENIVDFLYTGACCPTPAPTFCGVSADLAETPDNPAVSCFQSGANGYTGGAWSPLWDHNGTGGGSLQMTASSWWETNLWSRACTASDLNNFQSITFTIRNSAGPAATIYLRDFAGNPLGTPASFNVGAGATSTITVTLGNIPPGLTGIRWVLGNTGGVNVTLSLDAVYGTWGCSPNQNVVDGNCCSLITPTPTNTNTPTNTFTNTPTNTPTNTFTNSATFTPTNTNTNTPTRTPTNTPTNTNTPTFTYTPTNTFTNNPTWTPTNTFTETPTRTPTNSPTMTFTPTNTNTPTYTFTPTNTRTNTPVYTPTYTNTPTFTWTPTNTWTNTFTFTATSTPTRTNTPTYTYTPTNTNTNTNTWTATFTFTATYTATATNTPTSTFTATNTPTCTPTKLPFPFTLRVGIYNQAGELVKEIINSPVTALVGSVNLLSNGAETTALLSGAGAQLVFPGVETPSSFGTGSTIIDWNATNEAQQDIGSGIYYLKIEQRDYYNHINVRTMPLNVVALQEYVEMSIYNTSGELVRRIRHDGTPAAGTLDLKVASTLAPEKGAVISFGSSPSENFVWDGKNDMGKMVTPGTYEIQLELVNAEGKSEVAAKSVVVLGQETQFLKSVKAFPNPCSREKAGAIMAFAWDSAAEGTVRIFIINIKGEKTRELIARLSYGSAAWDLKNDQGSKVAPGVYVAIFEAASDEGGLNTAKVKIAVLH